ncbi:hypothetical protein HF325_001619 [Metschnikowia pulcherrima]|uniref:Uncharacterized protein n=1 Tax=Metschnikowia pulcherrima TaxID=27326 RepID=A0A8H7GX14_9ASCO|nr:hypothetical protein HF325_001619 [Metschnikowia pulcherrima]
MLRRFLILSLCALAWANTEAYGFQIPNYYDIPLHRSDSFMSNEVKFLNETSLILENHPILTLDSYSIENLVLTIPYDYLSKPKQRLYVRLNNYNNKHEFMGLESNTDNLDVYIVIDYQADFYAPKPVTYSDFKIVLAVSRLPNRLPIPIELYGFIVYLVDLLILVATFWPWISKFIFMHLAKS